MIRMDFEGGRELAAALEKLKGSLQKPVLRRAGLKALKPFLGAVKRLAPVSDTEGGALRDSYVIGTAAKLTPKEKGRARRERDSAVEVFAGTSNPAGKLQEFGTINHAAQPHARPAWLMTREAVADSFRDDLAAEIERTRKRAAKKAANGS